jgi:hypothetical protein
MGNLWEDFSLVGMGLRSLNLVGLYPLPSLGITDLNGSVYSKCQFV